MIDEFKVAFVVWINGRFVAPTTKHDLGCSDFWGSIYITSEIKEHNWGAYYLEHMMDAVARVEEDIRLGKSTILITSGPLLFQVLILCINHFCKVTPAFCASLVANMPSHMPSFSFGCRR
jgi:hypothetical protein